MISPSHVQPILPALYGRREPAVRVDLLRCCEPGCNDRWEKIIAEIPNVRAVSVSPWCDSDHRREVGPQR